MDKYKIRDIANELNTSGARIKEVLAELGIEVKSVASSITGDERKKLYAHFGLNEDGSTKEKEAVVSSVKREARQKGVVIVRRTEVHSKVEEEENSNTKGVRKNYIVGNDDGGLMSGLSHETGPRLQKKKAASVDEKPATNVTDTIGAGAATPTGPILLKKKPKPVEEKVEEPVEEKSAIEEEVKPENKEKIKSEDVEQKTDEMAKEKVEIAIAEEKKDEPKKEFSKVEDVKEDKEQQKREERRDDKKEDRHGKKREDNRDDRRKDRKYDKRDRNNKSREIEIPKVDFGTQKEESSRSADSQKISREKELAKNNLKAQKREGLSTKQNNNQNKNKKKNKNVDFRGKNTSVHDIVNDDDMLDKWYDGNSYRKKKKNKSEEKKYVPPKQTVTSISIPDSISVKELAEALKKTAAEVIKKLMSLGVMATLNSEIDYDTAALITEEFGVTPEKLVVVSEEDLLFDDDEDEDEAKLEPRDPVVVVMGHVDHGKTSLLDAIRNENVIEGEAGGITQHIGAYKVRINDRDICFLDTPGHEAFTAMRARGAQATDIAVLVVAADDGVMPQTVEAINHARAAGVKLVVAINKIDREGANPERVKQELTEHNVIPTAWGGDTEFVEVSAKQRLNIDELLEIILLEADMLELKADPNKQAKGTVIEARLDKARGSVASLLVQRGTLKTGDTIITGTAMGRIRAMINDKGKKIKAAGPSTPVEIIGLSEVPEAGEIFYAITDEKMARHLAEKRRAKIREEQLKSTSKVTLEDLFKQIQEGTVKDLNIIVKADVQGSVEAVTQSLEKLSNDEVRVKVIHGAVGAVSESDVTLAQVSGAIIIGFNVRPGNNVTEAAEAAGVDMRMYRVIYNAIEDVEAAIKGMLDPAYKEVVLGHAEIRQLYKVSGVGTIGGCYVTDGVIKRSAEVRIVRGGIVINEGKLASLKRFKDDAREVNAGFECGLMIERFNDIKEGDVVEAFEMVEVER